MNNNTSLSDNRYCKTFNIFTLQTNNPLDAPDTSGWSYGIRTFRDDSKTNEEHPIKMLGINLTLYYNGIYRDEVAIYYSDTTYLDYYLLKSSYDDNPFPNPYYTELTWNILRRNAILYIEKHYTNISKGFVSPVSLIARYPSIDTVYSCPAPREGTVIHEELYLNQKAIAYNKTFSKKLNTFILKLPPTFDQYYAYRILKARINDTLALYKYEYKNGDTRIDTVSLDRPLDWYWNKHEWNDTVINRLWEYKPLPKSL